MFISLKLFSTGQRIAIPVTAIREITEEILDRGEETDIPCTLIKMKVDEDIFVREDFIEVLGRLKSACH